MPFGWPEAEIWIFQILGFKKIYSLCFLIYKAVIFFVCSSAHRTCSQKYASKSSQPFLKYFTFIILGSLKSDKKFSMDDAFPNRHPHSTILYTIGKLTFWAFRIYLCHLCSLNRSRVMSVWKLGFWTFVLPRLLYQLGQFWVWLLH